MHPATLERFARERFLERHREVERDRLVRRARLDAPRPALLGLARLLPRRGAAARSARCASDAALGCA